LREGELHQPRAKPQQTAGQQSLFDVHSLPAKGVQAEHQDDAVERGHAKKINEPDRSRYAPYFPVTQRATLPPIRAKGGLRIISAASTDWRMIVGLG
jgi:hypothetical protein